MFQTIIYHLIAGIPFAFRVGKKSNVCHHLKCIKVLKLYKVSSKLAEKIQKKVLSLQTYQCADINKL